MKYLFGLCALLLTGHAMACSTAALIGPYKAKASGGVPGVLGGLVRFDSIASAQLNGSGGGTADIDSMAAGIRIFTPSQPITYTVSNTTDGSTNCVFEINVTYAGLTLSYRGYMDSAAKEIYVMSITPGTNVSGIVTKAQ